MGAAVGMGGCGERMTWVRMPCSSTICWTMCPGGTCMGMGTGGPLDDTIRTVAGPATHTQPSVSLPAGHEQHTHTEREREFG